MADHVDCIKMMALGRSFAIGTLYNYVEDVAIPSKYKKIISSFKNSLSVYHPRCIKNLN
jgi:hypothetical protein